jgi:hypothetical protein
MSTSRIGLCLLILLGLGGLALQNTSPTLGVTFLGMRSQPLSLGLLVVLAFGSGLATGLTLLTLVRLTRYLTRRKWMAAQTKVDQSPVEQDRPEPLPRPALPPEPKKPWRGWGQPEAEPWDDWEEEPGATKAVYDADFRVIRPPKDPPQQNPNQPRK